MKQGLEQGLEQGRIVALLAQMEIKFGRIPKWAKDRVSGGKPAQLERWNRKILIADTLEGVIGKR